MRRKKRGFHPLRKLKELIGKIGTLNLVLILVGAFLFGLTGKCLLLSGNMEVYQRHTLVLS